MCIIILNKKELLKKEVLESSWYANNDGAGLMYAVNNKLEIFKELKDFDVFYDYYKAIRQEYKKMNIGLHFRIGTSGLKDVHNIHPFQVNDNLAFMHNGIIDIELPKNSKTNDTIAFNESVLKQLPNNFLKDIAIKKLIASYIGTSKLLFLDNKNKYTIINEHKGHWDKKGNWFSNYSYCQYTYTNKPYTWDDYEYCDICNLELIEDYEIENGLCYNCYKKYMLNDNQII